MEEQLNFVDKSIVHKTKDENVHIYNMRRALPREIDVTTFEVDIMPHLSPEEEKFVMNYYVKRETLSGIAYILKTIPYKISQKRAETYLSKTNPSDEDLTYLQSMYEFNLEEGKYILTKDNITEEEELKILNILHFRNLHISDEEKFELSQIFEKIQIIPKKNIQFANLFVDQNHPYYFEHPQEHLPGMLIAEAGRQFIIAICHTYGKVPLNAIFMMTFMNCKFLNYIELNFPVKLRAKANEVKTSKQDQWAYYNGSVTFYQKNKEVAVIDYETNMVSKALFTRLRSEKDKYDQLPRFRPLPGVENNISLRDGARRYLCSIMNVSAEGFMLRFDTDEFATKSKIEEGTEIEFFMFFNKIGFVHGRCQIKWIVQDADDKHVAGFQISKIDKIDQDNLKEAIKFYFKLLEDREIL